MVIMIILLILCLPLILMLSLFTTTNVVSIVVDVPVTGIDVVVSEIVELDLDKGESFDIEYLITPTEASKKDVTLSFAAIGEDKLAQFSVDGSTITPTSAGSARVTLETVDGGYRDSFDVIVYTKRVESISSRPNSETLTVGEMTGIVTEYYPIIASNKSLTYRVKDGENVVTVSNSGYIQGIGIGTAIIEVASVDNPEAKSEFTVTVQSSGIIDFVSDTSYLTTLESHGEIKAVLNPEVEIESTAVELFDENGIIISDGIVNVNLNQNTGTVSYDFTQLAFVGVIEVRITVTPHEGETVTKSCYINRISEVKVGWAEFTDGKYSVEDSAKDSECRIPIDLKPLGANVSYFVSISYLSVVNGVGAPVEVETELTVGEEYVLDGGYFSLTVESTPTGVYLLIKRTHTLTMNDILNNYSVTEIGLSVHDNHNGSITVLEEISVS